MSPMKEMEKKETLDNVENGYKLGILEDLNGFIGDRVSAFVVSGENDKGRRVVGFWAERELCVGNPNFAYFT